MALSLRGVGALAISASSIFVLTSAIRAQAIDNEAIYEGRTVEQWIEQLAHTDKEARRKAAYALGQLGPEARQAVPALVKAADDKQLEVGWYALDALGRIGPRAESAVEDIVRIIQGSQRYPVLRLNAARTLGKIGPAAKAAAG